MKEGMNLNKEDFLIIWGGTKEVSRNEAQKGLSCIQKYAQLNINTNVIVLSLPQRRDLEDRSCLNKETMNFNRKPDKHLKAFDHVHYIAINYDRKYHTRLGMHLNTKGKEFVAKELAAFIKMQSKKIEHTVIPLNWKNAKKKDKLEKNEYYDTDDSSSSEEIKVPSSVDEEKQNGRLFPSPLGNRSRRQPVNRSNDFLW
jgi:hypothetical protein